MHFSQETTDMSEIKALIATAAAVDPLTLAILFIGLISLGVIWLASIALGGMTRSSRK
jgi:hypothetical protein